MGTPWAADCMIGSCPRTNPRVCTLLTAGSALGRPVKRPPLLTPGQPPWRPLTCMTHCTQHASSPVGHGGGKHEAQQGKGRGPGTSCPPKTAQVQDSTPGEGTIATTVPLKIAFLPRGRLSIYAGLTIRHASQDVKMPTSRMSPTSRRPKTDARISKHSGHLAHLRSPGTKPSAEGEGV